MANWLDKYEQGGLVLKKKTKDNYGKQSNYNDAKASVGPDFVGLGYNTKGRDYSPAWGGQFQNGGYMQKAKSFPVIDDIEKIGKDGSKVPDWEAMAKQAKKIGAKQVRTRSGATIVFDNNWKATGGTDPDPELATLQMGGSLPGSVGFTYARTAGSAPANGKYTKKTKASAQNGSVIKDDRGQLAYPGEITEINSNDITMQGVDYPVLGVSDTGDTKMMQPGQDYKFDGEKVTEYPMAQDGTRLNVDLKKQAEEFLARQNANRTTMSQYTPKKGEAERLDREKLQRIADENKPLNKFARSKASGNLQDAIEAAMIMEGGLLAGKLVGKGAKAAGKYLTEETALKNAYKLNPLAFKPKTDAYYRMIGEGGYADALESGIVRPPKELGQEYAYYNKGYPLDTRFRNATGRAGYEGPYMAEVKGNSELFVNENTQGFTGPMFDDPVVYSKAPISTSNPNVKLYKENWLQGYKEVPKPTSTSRRLTNEEIRAYNQKLFLDRKKGLGNQGPTDAPPEGLMPFESPEYKQGGWLDKYK
jgi:hypothetical protein